MPTIKKLKLSQNLTRLAYDSIKSYILREDLDEEMRLTEDALSSQLGISKSPVREALNSLQTEGLIHIEPRRGAYLRRFSIQEVKDLYGVREALEVYAVGSAAITPELLDGLRQSIQRMQKFLKAIDRPGHIDEEVKFHGMIATAAGNAELCRNLSNLQSQIWLCRRRTYDLSSSTSPDAHNAILEALKSGHSKAAQVAMKNHIEFVRDRLITYMESTK
jgi:DNA-binding GntR family transcriptional regulator